jgi:hypothetical protein
VNKFAIGALVGIGAMTVAVACGAGGLSPLARCKLAAIDAVLPDDVRQISIGDAIDPRPPRGAPPPPAAVPAPG